MEEPQIEKVVVNKLLEKEAESKLPEKSQEFNELSSINEKIEDLLVNSLPDSVIDRLRDIHPDVYRQAKDIKKILVELSRKLDKKGEDIVRDCRFNDRLGNFLGPSGFILRFVKGKKLDDDSYRRVLDSFVDFRNYFATCLIDSDYFENELGRKEGVMIQ